MDEELVVVVVEAHGTVEAGLADEVGFGDEVQPVGSVPEAVVGVLVLVVDEFWVLVSSENGWRNHWPTNEKVRVYAPQAFEALVQQLSLSPVLNWKNLLMRSGPKNILTLLLWCRFSGRRIWRRGPPAQHRGVSFQPLHFLAVMDE